MPLPMAAWRVTYAPGDWLVLSGPTTLVVLRPLAEEASSLVSDLWRSVVDAGSLDALLSLVAEVGLDDVADLGAFFWDDGGLHGLARGSVRVLDADSGEVAIEGRGSLTWREESLGDERRLRVELEPVGEADDAGFSADGGELRLPLVVGAVSASVLELSTVAADVVRFPARSLSGAGDEGASPVEGPGEESSEEVGSPSTPSFVPHDGRSGTGPGGEADSPFVPPIAAELGPQGHGPDLDYPGPEVAEFDSPIPEPAPFVPPVQDQGAFMHPAATPLASSLSSPGLPPVELPALDDPAALADGDSPEDESDDQSEDQADDDHGTIFSTGLAATHKPPRDDAPKQPQVLAVTCLNGHPNPPGSRACRICLGPVDAMNPQLIIRPALAGVHSNHGDFVNIVDGVIVGRGPDPTRGPAGARVMKVVSPSNDISRSHLLITTRGWNVHVTDLNSTNGTTILPLGEPPFTLRDGASVQVELGTVLDLGDGVSVRIEPPRN